LLKGTGMINMFPPRALEQIRELFEKEFFKVIKIKETVYQGTLDPLPLVLFVVMKNSKKVKLQ